MGDSRDTRPLEIAWEISCFRRMYARGLAARCMIVAERATAVVSDPAKICRVASPSTSF